MNENKPKQLKLWHWIISFVIGTYLMLNYSSNSEIGQTLLTTPSTEFSTYLSYTISNFGFYFLIGFILSIVVITVLIKR
ncbi:MAG: hypothetical protein ACYC59_12420 [Anaerolineaceae bacterium]